MPAAPRSTLAPVPDPAAFAAVLSDLDGTLVDSDAPVRRAWTAFAQRHGIDPEVAIRTAQGRPSREATAEMAPGDAEREARLLEQAETTDTDGLVALPGARELLSSSLTVAIVTSGSRRLAELRLRAAGLPLPDTMVCADDITIGKPDPQGYELAARRLGVDPAGCLVLEDAPAGVAAGRAAGATVLAVRTTSSDAQLAAADVIVDDLSALTLPPTSTSTR